MEESDSLRPYQEALVRRSSLDCRIVEDWTRGIATHKFGPLLFSLNTDGSPLLDESGSKGTKRSISEGKKEAMQIEDVSLRAYRRMQRDKLDQVIVVQGSSPAGKTTIFRRLLENLLENSHEEISKGAVDGLNLFNEFHDLFLSSRSGENDFSTCCGIYADVSFEENGMVYAISFGTFSEKRERLFPRTVSEGVFGAIIAFIRKGAEEDEDFKKKFCVKELSKYECLKQGVFAIKMVDEDDSLYSRTMDFLGRILSPDETVDVLRVISAILLIGNLNIREKDRCAFIQRGGDVDDVAQINRLLGLDDTKGTLCGVSDLICFTMVSYGRSLHKGEVTAATARLRRRMLMKSLYFMLTDVILLRINSIAAGPSNALCTGKIAVTDVPSCELDEIAHGWDSFAANAVNEVFSKAIVNGAFPEAKTSEFALKFDVGEESEGGENEGGPPEAVVRSIEHFKRVREEGSGYDVVLRKIRDVLFLKKAGGRAGASTILESLASKGVTIDRAGGSFLVLHGSSGIEVSYSISKLRSTCDAENGDEFSQLFRESQNSQLREMYNEWELRFRRSNRRKRTPSDMYVDERRFIEDLLAQREINAILGITPLTWNSELSVEKQNRMIIASQLRILGLYGSSELPLREKKGADKSDARDARMRWDTLELKSKVEVSELNEEKIEFEEFLTGRYSYLVFPQIALRSSEEFFQASDGEVIRGLLMALVAPGGFEMGSGEEEDRWVMIHSGTSVLDDAMVFEGDTDAIAAAMELADLEREPMRLSVDDFLTKFGMTLPRGVEDDARFCEAVLVSILGVRKENGEENFEIRAVDANENGECEISIAAGTQYASSEENEESEDDDSDDGEESVSSSSSETSYDESLTEEEDSETDATSYISDTSSVTPSLISFSDFRSTYGVTLPRSFIGGTLPLEDAIEAALYSVFGSLDDIQVKNGEVSLTEDDKLVLKAAESCIEAGPSQSQSHSRSHMDLLKDFVGLLDRSVVSCEHINGHFSKELLPAASLYKQTLQDGKSAYSTDWGEFIPTSGLARATLVALLGVEDADACQLDEESGIVRLPELKTLRGLAHVLADLGFDGTGADGSGDIKPLPEVGLIIARGGKPVPNTTPVLRSFDLGLGELGKRSADSLLKDEEVALSPLRQRLPQSSLLVDSIIESDDDSQMKSSVLGEVFNHKLFPHDDRELRDSMRELMDEMEGSNEGWEGRKTIPSTLRLVTSILNEKERHQETLNAEERSSLADIFRGTLDSAKKGSAGGRKDYISIVRSFHEEVEDEGEITADLVTRNVASLVLTIESCVRSDLIEDSEEKQLSSLDTCGFILDDLKRLKQVYVVHEEFRSLICTSNLLDELSVLLWLRIVVLDLRHSVSDALATFSTCEAFKKWFLAGNGIRPIVRVLLQTSEKYEELSGELNGFRFDIDEEGIGKDSNVVDLHIAIVQDLVTLLRNVSEDRAFLHMIGKLRNHMIHDGSSIFVVLTRVLNIQRARGDVYEYTLHVIENILMHSLSERAYEDPEVQNVVYDVERFSAKAIVRQFGAEESSQLVLATNVIISLLNASACAGTPLDVRAAWITSLLSLILVGLLKDVEDGEVDEESGTTKYWAVYCNSLSRIARFSNAIMEKSENILGKKGWKLFLSFDGNPLSASGKDLYAWLSDLIESGRIAQVRDNLSSLFSSGIVAVN